MKRWAGLAAVLLVWAMAASGAAATAAEPTPDAVGRLAILAADGPVDAGPAVAGADETALEDGSVHDHDERRAVLETDDGVIPLDPDSVPTTARTGATVSALVGDDGVGTVQAVTDEPTRTAAVTGTRKVLVVDVTWPGAPALSGPAPLTAMADADTWYESASGGRLSLTAELGPTITLPSAVDYCEHAFAVAPADTTVNAAMAPRTTSGYDHIIYRMPPSACGWLGIAYVGNGSNFGRRVMINGAMSRLVVVHELGHNLGLEHANFLYCENATHTAYSSIEPADVGRCWTEDYKDLYSAMGNYSTGIFNGPQLDQLGWLSAGNRVTLVGTDPSTCLFPLAGTSTGPKVARFDVDGIGPIYLENRQLEGVDTALGFSTSLGIQARTVRTNFPHPGPGVGDQTHLLPNRPERYPMSGTGYFVDDVASIKPGDPWAPLDGRVRVTTAAALPSGCIPVTVHNELTSGPPGAPATVTAAALNGSASVSWSAAWAPPGFPVTSYTATASPGGASCTTAQRTCLISGLSNGTAYTFTVTATNANGPGPASVASNSVRPPGRYTGVNPARLLETRGGLSTIDGISNGGGALGEGVTRSVQVTGRGGVPATGVGAVVLNITVTNPSFGGYVTAWPRGSARPTASNINFGARQTIANLAIVKVGTNGLIDLYNAFGRTDVIVDVQGWFPTGVALTPLTPARLLDTRSGTSTIDGQQIGGGPVGEKGTRSLPVLGRGGVPASGVGAVVLNVTVTSPTWYSYVTAFPHGSARPTASNVNFSPGQTVAIQVIAKVGSDGRVDLYNNVGSAHLVVDVQGWFPTGADITSLAPARLLDTRPGASTVDGVAAGGGALGQGSVRNLVVLGRGGVPATGVDAVALNVTVTNPSWNSYVTAYPHGASRPTASNVNFVPGQTVANLVIVKVGSDGTVDLYNNVGTAHVVADVQAWFPT